MSEAKNKAISDINGFAEAAFKDHEITCLLNQGVYRHYECRNRSGTSNYAFHVVTFPGRLIVSGDIGDLMLCRVHDMFQWAPRAIESIAYFAEKVVGGDTKEYCHEVTQEVISEAWKEIDERRDQEDGDPEDNYEYDLLISDITNPHTTLTEMHDSQFWDGCDFPDTENWKPNFLWCREALRWFFANHEKGNQ